MGPGKTVPVSTPTTRSSFMYRLTALSPISTLSFETFVSNNT